MTKKEVTRKKRLILAQAAKVVRENNMQKAITALKAKKKRKRRCGCGRK